MNFQEAKALIKYGHARRVPNRGWVITDANVSWFPNTQEINILEIALKTLWRVPTCQGKNAYRHGDHYRTKLYCRFHGRRFACEIDEGGLCLECGEEVF